MSLHILTRISQALMALGLLGLFVSLPFMVADAADPANVKAVRLISLGVVMAGFVLAFAIEAYWKKNCKVA